MRCNGDGRMKLSTDPEQHLATGVPGQHSLSQRSVWVLLKSGIGAEDGSRQGACLAQQVRVLRQSGHLEIHPTRLTSPEQVSLAPLFEIELGNPEAILGGGEGPQPI